MSAFLFFVSVKMHLRTSQFKIFHGGDTAKLTPVW